MSRLHGALRRATDGQAPILPREAGIGPGDEDGEAQPAFSVPWSLDAAPPEAPGHSSGSAVLDAPPPPFSADTPRPPRASVDLRPPETREKLVGTDAADPGDTLALAVEQYKKVAAALHRAQANTGLKLIVVTSANPGEGKSLTASNLALTLAESYQRRVLLIDGDLRRPSLDVMFGVSNASGLTDGLAREPARSLALFEISPRLTLLPSGGTVEDPTVALTSSQMRGILDDARANYDWIIIDTPPIGLLSDARLLTEMADGVLLVVEAEKSPYPDLVRAVDSIGRDRVLGVVLNRMPRVSAGSYYYGNYYGNYPSRSSRPSA